MPAIIANEINKSTLISTLPQKMQDFIENEIRTYLTSIDFTDDIIKIMIKGTMTDSISSLGDESTTDKIIKELNKL